MSRWEERRRKEKQQERLDRGEKVNKTNLPYYIRDTNPNPTDSNRGKGVDWGYAPRDYGEMEDRAMRAAYPGLQLRSAYSQFIGTTPTLRPDDRTGAWVMVRKIDQALEHGGWTKNENHRLHQMREKWMERAHGQDVRFQICGNKGGAMTPEQREKVTILRGFERINKEIERSRQRGASQLSGQQVIEMWTKRNRQMQDEGE